MVVCSLPAANRDPRVGRGDDVDLAHASGSHLAFGYGFHRCIGAELARMELKLAFPALARRFPDMRLACPAEDLDYRALSIVYGVKRSRSASGKGAKGTCWTAKSGVSTPCLDQLPNLLSAPTSQGL